MRRGCAGSPGRPRRLDERLSLHESRAVRSRYSSPARPGGRWRLCARSSRCQTDRAGHRSVARVATRSSALSRSRSGARPRGRDFVSRCSSTLSAQYPEHAGPKIFDHELNRIADCRGLEHHHACGPGRALRIVEERPPARLHLTSFHGVRGRARTSSVSKRRR